MTYQGILCLKDGENYKQSKKIAHRQTKLNTALKMKAKNYSAIKKNAKQTHSDEAAIIKGNVWKPHNKTLCTV